MEININGLTLTLKHASIQHGEGFSTGMSASMTLVSTEPVDPYVLQPLLLAALNDGEIPTFGITPLFSSAVFNLNTETDEIKDEYGAVKAVITIGYRASRNLKNATE